MKIRLGFVSNSSSTSFVISKNGLTAEQIAQILDHIEAANKLAEQGKVCYKLESWDPSVGHKFKVIGCAGTVDVGVIGGGDAWRVEERDKNILVGTEMTNFSMDDFLEAIGVPEENISCRSDSSWPNESDCSPEEKP